MNKIRKIKNKKFNNKRVIGLATLLFVTGLVTSCDSTITTTEFEYSRIECNSEGYYSETKQYKSFNPDSRKDLPSSFIYYDKWEQKDGKYSRFVKEYSVRDKTYDDIKVLFDSNTEIEEVLGKPIDSYEQISKSISEEELSRDPYFEATFYSKDKKNYITIKKEASKKLTIMGICLATFTVGVSSLITWKYLDNKKNKKLTLKRDN